MSAGAQSTIEWLRADELPELQAYIDMYWRPNHVLAVDAALARWQYRHPQDDSLLSVLGARDERKRLVGFLGLVQVPFVWLGDALEAGWLAMWSAVPERRSSGLGLSLLLDAMERFEVVAALGFNERAGRIFSALDFDVRWSLPRWVRVGDEAAYERLAGQPPPAVGGGGLATAHPVQAVAWSDDAATRWQERWRRLAPGIVGSARDAAFLRRRYVEHPSFAYVVRFAETPAGDLGALCVHRVEPVRTTESVIRIVELLGDTALTVGLARLALEESPDAALADFSCTAPRSGEMLEQLGFVREDTLGEPPPDRFQPVERSRGLDGAFWRRGAGGAAFAGAPLYATRADGDQDRPP